MSESLLSSKKSISAFLILVPIIPSALPQSYSFWFNTSWIIFIKSLDKDILSPLLNSNDFPEIDKDELDDELLVVSLLLEDEDVVEYVDDDDDAELYGHTPPSCKCAGYPP